MRGKGEEGSAMEYCEHALKNFYSGHWLSIAPLPNRNVSISNKI